MGSISSIYLDHSLMLFEDENKNKLLECTV